MVRLAIRRSSASAKAGKARDTAPRYGESGTSGTDDVARNATTCNNANALSSTTGGVGGGSKAVSKDKNEMKATTRSGANTAAAVAADDSLCFSSEGDGDDDANILTTDDLDYNFGCLDDVASGIYKPLSKVWGVKAISKVLVEQCSATNRASADTADAAANNACTRNDSANCDQSHTGSCRSRRSVTSTNTNTSTSIDIDVSADLGEIAQRQADLLYNETFAATRQEVLQQQQQQQQQQRSTKKGRFKKGLLLGRGNGGGASSASKVNVTTSTPPIPKSRRVLSPLRKDKNNNHKSNKSSKTTKLSASVDRPVLAVVNDFGIDLINVSLQQSNDDTNYSNNHSKDGDNAGTGTTSSSNNDEPNAKAVDTSDSTTGTSGSATYSATLRPEGMDTSINLFVKTGPATATATGNANNGATAAAVTTTYDNDTGGNKQGPTGSAKNGGDATTVGSFALDLNSIDAIAHATDDALDALASILFGPAAADKAALAQDLVKGTQQAKDARRYYQEAVAAEQGGDIKGAQKWFGLASMAQQMEAKAKANTKTMGAETEQSLMACGLEVRMAPSTLTDVRSVGSTVAFDEDEDDDGGTFVSTVISVMSNDYTYHDGNDDDSHRAGGRAGRADAVDNRGTDTRSDLGLGGITSSGGGEASTTPARTPADVRPAAGATTAATTTTTRGAKATSAASFTVEDPTFVLDMSSIDEMMASFSADVKPEARQEKPAVSQPNKNKKKPTQSADVVEDEPPLERSEFVVPVFNLLVRAYGAGNFSGDDRWERVNVILDNYKGREDRLIQSLLIKAAKREAKQKKDQSEAGAKTNNTGTPSDSFQLDVSSIDVEAAPISPLPSEAPQKPDLSFRNLATRPVDDDDSLFGDLDQSDVEPVDNAGPSSRSPPTTVIALGNYALTPPPTKSASASSRGDTPQGKASAPKTPSTVGVNSDSDCSPAHNTSMQSNGSSSSAFDFGASSNPFKRLDFAENDGDTNEDANNQFGYTHEYAAGSQKSGGFTSMVDSEDEESSPVKPMRPLTQRRAGRASTRLRSILQGGAASAKAESASLLHN